MFYGTNSMLTFVASRLAGARSRLTRDDVSGIDAHAAEDLRIEAMHAALCGWHVAARRAKGTT